MGLLVRVLLISGICVAEASIARTGAAAEALCWIEDSAFARGINDKSEPTERFTVTSFDGDVKTLWFWFRPRCKNPHDIEDLEFEVRWHYDLGGLDRLFFVSTPSIKARSGWNVYHPVDTEDKLGGWWKVRVRLDYNRLCDKEANNCEFGIKKGP